MTADRMHMIVGAYRVMAYLTGVALIVLVFVGIPLQVFAHSEAVVKIVGVTHGMLYIVYVLVALLMTIAVRMRTLSVATVVVLLAGVLPVLTFVIERWATRRYITPALAAADGGQAAAPAPVGG